MEYINKKYEKDGKIFGEIIDGVFRKNVSHKKHFHRKSGGYPVAEEVAKDLLKCGCYLMVFAEYENDNSGVYSISYSDFVNKHVIVNEDGYERQWCVPLTKWKVVK